MSGKRTIEEIPMKDVQLLTAKVLKESGVPLETTLGTIFALSSEKRILATFLIWAYDNHPTEEQVLHWIVEHT